MHATFYTLGSLFAAALIVNILPFFDATDPIIAKYDLSSLKLGYDMAETNLRWGVAIGAALVGFTIQAVFKEERKALLDSSDSTRTLTILTCLYGILTILTSFISINKITSQFLDGVPVDSVAFPTFFYNISSIFLCAGFFCGASAGVLVAFRK